MTTLIGTSKLLFWEFLCNFYISLVRYRFWRVVCSKLQAVDHMLQHPPSGADEVISSLSWQLVTAIIHNEEGDGLTL